MPTCYDAHGLYVYISTSGDLLDPVARQRYSDRELRALAMTAGRAAIDVSALGDKRRDDDERAALLRGLEDELCTELRELLCGASVGRDFNVHSIVHDIAILSIAALPAVVERVTQSMNNPFHQHVAWQVLSALGRAYGAPDLTA
mgnify:FL=1